MIEEHALPVSIKPSSQLDKNENIIFETSTSESTPEYTVPVIEKRVKHVHNAPEEKNKEKIVQ